jgi:hypothetical protein
MKQTTGTLDSLPRRALSEQLALSLDNQRIHPDRGVNAPTLKHPVAFENAPYQDQGNFKYAGMYEAQDKWGQKPTGYCLGKRRDGVFPWAAPTPTFG